MGKKMPKVFAAFSVGSFALTGIPLLPGFVSKFYLAKAAVATQELLPFLGVIALLISAILTSAYLFKVMILAYFPGNDFEESSINKVEDPNYYMWLPLLILCLAMIIIGAHPQLLIGYLSMSGITLY